MDGIWGYLADRLCNPSPDSITLFQGQMLVLETKQDVLPIRCVHTCINHSCALTAATSIFRYCYIFPSNSTGIYPSLTSVLTSGATHNKSCISPIWLLTYWKWNNLLLPWSFLFIGYAWLVTISILWFQISVLSCPIPVVSFQVCFTHTCYKVPCTGQESARKFFLTAWLSLRFLSSRHTILGALIPCQFVLINPHFIFSKYQTEMLSVHPGIFTFYIFLERIILNNVISHSI